MKFGLRIFLILSIGILFVVLVPGPWLTFPGMFIVGGLYFPLEIGFAIVRFAFSDRSRDFRNWLTFAWGTVWGTVWLIICAIVF